MIENKKATQIGDNEPKLPSESGFLFRFCKFALLCLIKEASSNRRTLLLLAFWIILTIYPLGRIEL